MKCSVWVGLVGVLICPLSAQAQGGLQGFASVSFGVQSPATKDFVQQASVPFRFEEATFEAGYEQSSGAAFDLYGGVLAPARFGVGIGITRFAKDSTGSARVVLPHPFFFERNATDTAEADPLPHSERAFHINAVYVPVRANRLRVMVFGGPARVTVKQRLVEDFDIAETLFEDLDYTIDISDFVYETDTASAWGFNVGADVSYMMTGTVGFGGMLRVLRATVQLRDSFQSALQDTTVRNDYKAGGVVGAFGVRVYFGGR
jgi:hypothetical protein